MKYIRTEYGLGEWLTIDKCWHYSSSITIDDNPRKQLKPIKQADTIEELCDEFVIDNPLNWRPFPFTTPDVDKVKLLLKNHPVSLIKYNIKIYGAIWTDKGLIYVAKLNEKGELELI